MGLLTIGAFARAARLSPKALRQDEGRLVSEGRRPGLHLLRAPVLRAEDDRTGVATPGPSANTDAHKTVSDSFLSGAARPG